jgi:hypothetical protein
MEGRRLPLCCPAPVLGAAEVGLADFAGVHVVAVCCAHLPPPLIAQVISRYMFLRYCKRPIIYMQIMLVVAAYTLRGSKSSKTIIRAQRVDYCTYHRVL